MKVSPKHQSPKMTIEEAPQLTIQAVNEKYNLITEADSPVKVKKSPKFTSVKLNNTSGESPRKLTDRQSGQQLAPLEPVIKETDESATELHQPTLDDIAASNV